MIPPLAGEGEWNGIRELMALRKDRPFLSEFEVPTPLGRMLVSILSPLSGKNMLYYLWLLVVGFFNQETVIFDFVNCSS